MCLHFSISKKECKFVIRVNYFQRRHMQENKEKSQRFTTFLLNNTFIESFISLQRLYIRKIHVLHLQYKIRIVS